MQRAHVRQRRPARFGDAETIAAGSWTHGYELQRTPRAAVRNTRQVEPRTLPARERNQRVGVEFFGQGGIHTDATGMPQR